MDSVIQIPLHVSYVNCFLGGTLPIYTATLSGATLFQEEFEVIFGNGVINDDMSVSWLMSLLDISDIV